MAIRASSCFRRHALVREPERRQLIDALESDDVHQQAAAAVRLGQLRVTEALDMLQPLCNSREPAVALAAMFACWEMGEDRIDAERLATALAARSETTQQFAAHFVTAVGARLVARLTPMLEGAGDRASAILCALDDIHTREARQAVVQAQLREPELDLQRQEILKDWGEDETGSIA